MQTRFLNISALVALALGALFLFAPKAVHGANNCVSTTSGTFNTAGTWGSCGGTFPQIGDTAQIVSGHTISINATTNSLAGLTADGTLTVSGGNVNVNSATANLTVNGTLTYSSGTNRTITVTGDVVIANGGTLQTADGTGINAHSLLVGGNLTNNGTITLVNNDDVVNVTFNGTGAQSIGGSSSTTFSGLTINNSGGSVTLNTGATVSGLLTLTSNLTMSSGIVLTQTGTCAGAADAIGTVARINPAASTTYCFGNPNNQITFPSALVGVVRVILTKTTPGGFTGNVVGRYYEITSPTFSGNATLRLRYLESELPSFTGGKTESDLVFYKRTTGAYGEQGGAVDTTNNHVTIATVPSFSDWAFAASGTPTNVILTAFKVKATIKPSVKVKWETGSEVNVVGFNVYRSNKKNGTYEILNAALLEPLHPGEVLGATYKFKDKTVEHGKTYFYYLEVVTTGETNEYSEIKKVTVP